MIASIRHEKFDQQASQLKARERTRVDSPPVTSGCNLYNMVPQNLETTKLQLVLASSSIDGPSPLRKQSVPCYVAY